ncbi:MAG: beta-glucosidase [Anaerolineae bacterium]|nr:beta-glucosidase [Anaerolineae bacterium]
MTFPQEFLWGAATSSYQIEGASLEDGRGECIWHRFSHTPGNVTNNEHGDVACDHYHRYQEDVALMKDLGIQAYRFSIAWPRVMPEGIGRVNEPGLDFYNRLVDELLAAGIRPFVTLYHWDLPQALQDKGGWANRDILGWFSDYTALMAKTLGDRVKDWMTINEPFVVSFVGHHQGRHAPGIRHLPTAIKVAHHELLAHGKAVPIIREQVPGASVGIVLDYGPAYPASDSEQDKDAARRWDGYHNRWFLDPIFKGSYPADIVEIYGDMMADLDVSEISAAAVPTDFVGVNYYTRSVNAWDATQPPLHFRGVLPPNIETTTMNWEIYPDGLRQSLMRIHQDYAPKAIYIAENGSAFEDAAPTNGVVEDPRRAAYLESHLKAVEQAIAEGAPVTGYFAWSLLDNFEWAFGYEKRFGIVHVDFETLKRTPKRTAYVYRDWINAHS